jgi:uncharacterized protein YukE
MTGTEVLTGSLMEVAASVEELIGRYRQSVLRFYAIGQELDAMWDGLSGDKFASKLSNDQPRFEAMATLLEAYVAVLRQDASIYVKAESDVLNVLNTNLA